MSRKIAFISPVPIKISKNVEGKIDLFFGSIHVWYKHPVLYVVRETKKDKEYIYIYCGSTTFVLMRIKEANLKIFLDALAKVLSDYIDNATISSLLGSIELYSSTSNLIDDIYYETLKETRKIFEFYRFTLLNFDPILRESMQRSLLINIARITLRSLIPGYYWRLPDKIREKITLREFKRIVHTEISLKNIYKSIIQPRDRQEQQSRTI